MIHLLSFKRGGKYGAACKCRRPTSLINNPEYVDCPGCLAAWKKARAYVTRFAASLDHLVSDRGICPLEHMGDMIERILDKAFEPAVHPNDLN